MDFKLYDYLNENFKGNILEPAMFYNWDIGIRFELGVPYRGIEDPDYFANLIERAVRIFESVFEPGDDIVLVVRSYETMEPFETLDPGDPALPICIKNNLLIPNIICAKEEKDIDDEGIISGIMFQHYISCKRDEINCYGIFEAIANADFCKKPYTHDGVYFINVSKDIIFHMYDDRGLDVVAKNKDSLMIVYSEFNDWILDYDRKKIDGVFKE